MSIFSIGNTVPQIHNTAAGLPGGIQDQSPLEQASSEADSKAQRAQKAFADVVNISPEGRDAAKALFTALNGLRPSDIQAEPEADEAGDTRNQEPPKTGDSPEAPENDKAPADEETPGDAPDKGGEGGGGGGNEALAQKLEKLKEEKKKLEKEIAQLKRQAGDEAAKAEAESKTAEKEQIDNQIKALEQQMKAQG